MASPPKRLRAHDRRRGPRRAFDEFGERIDESRRLHVVCVASKRRMPQRDIGAVRAGLSESAELRPPLVARPERSGTHTAMRCAQTCGCARLSGRCARLLPRSAARRESAPRDRLLRRFRGQMYEFALPATRLTYQRNIKSGRIEVTLVGLMLDCLHRAPAEVTRIAASPGGAMCRICVCVDERSRESCRSRQLLLHCCAGAAPVGPGCEPFGSGVGSRQGSKRKRGLAKRHDPIAGDGKDDRLLALRRHESLRGIQIRANRRARRRRADHQRRRFRARRFRRARRRYERRGLPSVLF